MAKKKAAAVVPPCLHCSVEFRTPIGWCTRCECHMSVDELRDGTCRRCISGANDRYNKRRAGGANRVAETLVKIVAEHGLFAPPFTGPLSLAYEAWCASPEYEKRFNVVAAVTPPTPEEQDNEWIDQFAGL